jgi:hypothetical protein
VPWLSRLLADLEEDGASVSRHGHGRVVISSYGDDEYSPPVVLLTTDDDLEFLMRTYRGMVPGASLKAAYELFWANLDETFATIRGGSVVSIKRGGLSVELEG